MQSQNNKIPALIKECFNKKQSGTSLVITEFSDYYRVIPRDKDSSKFMNLCDVFGCFDTDRRRGPFFIRLQHSVVPLRYKLLLQV